MRGRRLVSQAAGQHATMVAQIVTEINAPDLAAGDVGGAGVVAEGNDAEDTDYVDSKSAYRYLSCTCMRACTTGS